MSRFNSSTSSASRSKSLRREGIGRRMVERDDGDMAVDGAFDHGGLRLSQDAFLKRLTMAEKSWPPLPCALNS